MWEKVVSCGRVTPTWFYRTFLWQKVVSSNTVSLSYLLVWVNFWLARSDQPYHSSFERLHMAVFSLKEETKCFHGKNYDIGTEISARWMARIKIEQVENLKLKGCHWAYSLAFSLANVFSRQNIAFGQLAFKPKILQFMQLNKLSKNYMWKI